MRLSILALLSTALVAQQPAASVYITHVTVVDTETGNEARDQTVVISGARIAEIRPAKQVRVAAGARSIDARGKYIIPGLWDMHVHGNNLPMYASFLPLYIANGVTGIREMFGPRDANKFRAELATQHLDAPHIYLASPIVDGDPPVWPNSVVVKSPAEARLAVDQQKNNRADFIKVYSRLAREDYFAIMDQSRRERISVQGHVPLRVSAWEAAAAGQKSFEHLTGIALACSTREEELWPRFASASSAERRQLIIEAHRTRSAEKCRRLFAQLKSNRVWQVPTLTALRDYGWLNDPAYTNDARLRYFGSEVRDWLTATGDVRVKGFTDADFALEREAFAYDLKLTGDLFRSGVPMLAGTDALNPYCFPGFSIHDELALLVESGASPLAALQAATRNAAQFMDSTDRYGSVTPGKIADLVLLNADPLQDIHNTSKISEVFLGGQEFDRAALDAILARAEAAAGGAQSVKNSERHYLYVAEPGIRNYLEYGGIGIIVFDIDNGYKFVKRIPTWETAAGKEPENVKGIAASAATGRLYVTTINRMAAFDISTGKKLFDREYAGGCDRMAISPDGKILYVPSLEGAHWNVVDGETGDVIAKVEPRSGSHNTIFSLDGSRVYLAGLRSTYLSVADAKTHTVVKTVGPFSKPIRPFTVNGRGTLVFANLNDLAGFEVGDLTTGKVLHRVEFQDYHPGPLKRHGCPSHGIALTPDERELWVVDGANNSLHVFDATLMPPRQILTVGLRDFPGWVSFSIDGRQAYLSTGEIIDTKTKKVLATLTDEAGRAVQSEKLLELVFENGKVTRAGNQFGVGAKQ